jgi:hypothetical protein
MRHQVFSTFYQFILADKIKDKNYNFYCKYANHQYPIVPRYDNEKQKTYLQCLDCNDITWPGMAMYDEILKELNEADPYPEDPAFDSIR